MYRTRERYETLKDEPLKYPICVPSYNRPDNGFIQWVKKTPNLPKENLYMFIRNTPEQKTLYKPLSKWVNLVLIPASTKDVGETRRHIIDWGVKHGHKLLFMLDDRVNGVWWLEPVVRNGKAYLDVAKDSTPTQAFKLWADQHILNGMLMTGISSKGFHWMTDRINYPIEPLNGTGVAVCIGVSPIELVNSGVNYKSISEAGVEDLQILYQLLINKLPFCMLHDFCYNQVPPCASGGNSEEGLARDERLLKYKKLFWEKSLGLNWGTPHPGFVIRQRKQESNVVYINRRYWREYYADSK